MKLAAIAVALVAALGVVSAGDSSTLGHPVQFFREGSASGSAGSLRRVDGSQEDSVFVPTPKPTTFATPAPTSAGATPAPTTSSSGAATPAPTTADGSDSAVYGTLGVAYSITKDEVEAASTSSSTSSSDSYTVPIAVAGCVAAVAAVAGVAIVARKRKQQQKENQKSVIAEGQAQAEAEYDDISTPVA